MRPKVLIAAVLAACATASVLCTAPADAPTKTTSREQQLIHVLTSNASFADKDKACRELRRIGARACIPALARLLTDEKLSHMARYALEPMPFPEAGEALRNALPKTSGQVQLGIASSLGFRRDAAATPALSKLLKADDKAVAAAAAHALGRIGTPQAAQALADFRKHAAQELRFAAAEASLAAARRLAKTGHAPDAAKVYAELRGDEWPARVRLAAFAGLLAAEPHKAAPRVMATIRGDDAALRGVAINSIATLKGEHVAETIAVELPELPAGAQVVLIEALAKRGGAAVRDAILRLGKTSSGKVRIAAMAALEKIGDASCAAWLAEAAAAGATREEREAAAKALVMLPGADLNAQLVAQMKKAEPKAKALLLDVLMRRNAAAAVDAALAEAKSADARVRRAAFKALARLASPPRLPALVSLLEATPDDAARSDAEKAVAQVARKIPDESKRADAVLAALTKTKAPGARAPLLRALAAIAGPKALAAVSAACSSPDAVTRDAAARALASWPDPSAADALLRVCQAAESDVHRVLALRGLVRVAGMRPGLPDKEAVALYREAGKAVKTADERKMLLSGLSRVAHPDALTMAMAWVGEEAVHAEAALAALKIGEAILGVHRSAAEAALKKLAAAAKDPKVRQQAQALLNRAKAWEDYIVAWYVAGPYRRHGRRAHQLFNVAFAPETRDAESVQWRPLPPKSKKPKRYILDMRTPLGGNHAVGYIRTWVYSERATQARLEIGVDDGVKVWLNGKVVYRSNSAGAAIPGEEKAAIQLKQGWNWLLLKVIQHTGPWEICARLRTPDGKKLDGLRIDPTHEGAMVLARPAQQDVDVSQDLSDKSAAPIDHKAPGWKPIFNGKDLAGWTHTGKGVFKVVDGCLVGTQTDGKGGDLWCNEPFDDFEFRATYRMVWPGNSGFWFRHNGRKGYQFDILKYERPVAFSGSLYCPGKLFITTNLKEAIEHRDGWNEACIRAQGDELTLWLNGKQVGRCKDSELRRGRIGIQVHPGDSFKGMQIVVKRMDVRPLGASKKGAANPGK